MKNFGEKLSTRYGAPPQIRIGNIRRRPMHTGNHFPEEPHIQDDDPVDNKVDEYKCKA